MGKSTAPPAVQILPGIREDLDDRAEVQPGTLSVAQNVRFTGVGGAVRRRGLSALTSPVATGTLTAILGGATANAVVSDGTIYRRADTWSELSPSSDSKCSKLLPVRRRQSFAAVTPYQEEHYEPSIVAVGGYVFCACRQRYDIGSAADTIAVAYFVESEDGRRIAEGTIASKEHAVLVVVGSTVYLVVQETTTVSVYSMSVSAGVLTGPTLVGTVGTLSASTDHWDAAPWTSTHWLLVYQNSSTQATVRKMSAGTSADSVTFTCTAGSSSIFSIYANTTHVYVGHYDAPTATGTIRGIVYDANLDLTGGPTTIATITSTRGSPPWFGPASIGTKARYVYRDQSDADGVLVTVAGVLTSAGSNTAGASTPNITPTSYPFDGLHCAFLLPTSDTVSDARNLIARETGTETSSAKYSVLELSAELSANSPQQSVAIEGAALRNRVAVLSDGTMLVASAYVAREGTLSNKLRRIDVVQFEEADALDSCVSPDGHVLAGQPVEVLPTEALLVGFPTRPAILSAQSAGAGSIDAGSHQWKTCLEDIDSLGRVHRSAPGGPRTLSSGIAFDAEIIALTCGFRPGALPAVYRTQAGLTEAQRASPGSGADDYAFATGKVTFTDDASDTTIGDQQFIYTDGGTKRNALAPCCRYVCASEEAMWFAGLWQRNIVQRSRLFVPGEPVQCTDHDSHKVALPSDVTGGCAYMDTTAIFFCNDGIYAVSGDGPNDRGEGSFAPPRVVARGLTCVDYRSILETPMGVFFRAKSGFYLLPRGLGTPQFVGDGIRRTAREYSTVLGAVLDGESPDELTARFLVQRPADSATKVLVFSLTRQAWSVDAYPYQLGAIGSWPGGVLFARADLSQSNPLLFEDADDDSVLDDAGTFFEARLELHRIYPFGQFGIGQVQSVSALVSAPDGQPAEFTLEMTLDDRPESYSHTWQITTVDRPEARKKSPHDSQACTALDIAVYDSSASSANYGLAFHGFAIQQSEEAKIRNYSQGEQA